MMPFTALRSLLLLAISWLILGLGLYFAVNAYQRFQRPAITDNALRQTTESSTQDTDEFTDRLAPDTADIDVPVVVTGRRDDWVFWRDVAIAAVCLGLSVGGRLPVRIFMKRGGQAPRPLPPPESTYEIDRPDGSRLHCTVYGNNQDATLILTHGWSLNASAWRYILPMLAERYRVVVWDLPGLGKSRGPSNNDYRVDKLANDLRAVVDKVASDGSVILVGHSIGGMTLQAYCRLHHDTLNQSVKDSCSLIRPILTHCRRTCWLGSLSPSSH